jgi:hypothetical protein
LIRKPREDIARHFCDAQRFFDVAVKKLKLILRRTSIFGTTALMPRIVA